jgi:hypothetical protein
MTTNMKHPSRDTSTPTSGCLPQIQPVAFVVVRHSIDKHTYWSAHEVGDDVLEAGTHVLYRAWLTWTSPLDTGTQASRGLAASSGMNSGGGTDSQAGRRQPSASSNFPAVHFGYIRMFGGKVACEGGKKRAHKENKNKGMTLRPPHARSCLGLNNDTVSTAQDNSCLIRRHMFYRHSPGRTEENPFSNRE